MLYEVQRYIRSSTSQYIEHQVFKLKKRAAHYESLMNIIIIFQRFIFYNDITLTTWRRRYK